MQTNNKTVAQLRAEGWAVVLISPSEMESQAGELKRYQIELIEDLLGDQSVDLISDLHWSPKRGRDE